MNFICNPQKWEAKCPSRAEWVNCGKSTEWNTAQQDIDLAIDTHNNMGESNALWQLKARLKRLHTA